MTGLAHPPQSPLSGWKKLFVGFRWDPKGMGARSGSLRHSGVYDQGRQGSERIDHLKTADAADIEMGGLFFCEVDAFSCEITDAQGMNVTSSHRKIVTNTHTAIFLE
jgi:hypothetical protein